MAQPEPVLPQQATPADAVITSVQWLFEPCWSGDRLMARLQAGRVTLTDAAGEPAGPEFAEAADELLAAIDADAAVIDGIWTGHGGDVRLELADPSSMRARRTFVAIDLVELEGASLAQVPYQERRRLLASVLAEKGRVRISPSVRQPAGDWLRAWWGDGFTHYVAKHVNSRYHPGERADDWLIVSAKPETSPSIGGRLLGRRPKKLLLIED